MDDDERHPAEMDRDGTRRWDRRDIEYHCVVGFSGKWAANYLTEHRDEMMRGEFAVKEER